MLNEKQKKRIKLYSASHRSRIKASQRRADAAESAGGNAAIVQERNRALPPASQMMFIDQEESLPTE
jgi:hypothetical protein